MTAPRLMAARMLRRNRHSLLGVRGQIVAWLGLCAIVALFFVEREGVMRALDWLRSHGLLCDGLAAVASAVMVARRRALKRAEFARSWLAAVPIRASTARWEALIIEALPALVAMAALTALGILVGLLQAFSSGAVSRALLLDWAGLMAGIAVGVIASYAMPAPKPVDLPPGSRYVPHKKAHKTAAIRPSLAALGVWPVRQMFAWAQPKVVARGSIPILVMMPMGTTADAAMVVIAMAAIGGALMLLWTAAISVSRLSRRWMAPLPARAESVTRALLFPTLGGIVAASAAETLLLLVFDVALGKALAVGLCTAAVGCLVAFGGVQLSGAPRKHMP
jgi:hypothetical protein